MTLPVIGAAMPSQYLPQYREWLLADQRDLEIQDFVMPNVIDGDWRSLVGEIKAQLDGYTGRMGIHGLFLGMTVAVYDPKIRAVVIDRLKQTLEICGELGATHMVVHSPFEHLGMPDHRERPNDEDKQFFDLIHQTLSEVVPLAESVGCTLVIENIFDKVPALLTGLVTSFNSSAVRQSLDTGHAYINFMQGAPAPDAWVEAAGELLAHVHVQDTDGHGDRHWLPGEGKINWGALFAALNALPQQPRLILELRDVDGIGRAAQWLADQGYAR